MADGGNPVKRLKVEPERNTYREALEGIANFVDNELGNGRAPRSRPDDREWRIQRVYTIRTLKKFKEKLDTDGVRPNSGKPSLDQNSGNPVGNGTGIASPAGSLIGTVTSFLGLTCSPWVTNIGNGLTSSSMATSIGRLATYTGTCIGGVSNKIESHISEKYLREIEAVLEEDQTLTRPLAKWLNYSNELDVNVQKIFGVSLTSGTFNSGIKVFHDTCKLSNSIRGFDDIISLLKQGKYSEYMGNVVKIEKLEKFYQCLSASPQLADRMRRILSTLSAQPEDVQVFVDGIRVYRSIMQISSSSVAPTVQDGLNPEVPTTGEASVFCVFQTVKLAIRVVSLINTASIIRHGTTQYSDAIKQLTCSLAWELERMENLSF